MKHNTKKNRDLFYKSLLMVWLGALISATLPAQTHDALDDYILQAMTTHHIPGLSAVVIKDGKLVYSKGFGFANYEKNYPFTPNTVNAEIASVSKTITATAIMQLYEKDKFKLDDDINLYLPFAIRNPYYPNTPITFRMLLAHTSSLYTNYDDHYDCLGFKTKKFPTLEKYIYDNLVPGGLYYVDSLCYYKEVPGSKWHYNGPAFALIGYLVEIISHQNFETYCNENIFYPLCMNHTAWHFNKVDERIVSHPYRYELEANTFSDAGLYEYPSYPEGQLKTSVVDLAKFLWMNMNDGMVGNTKILNPETVKLMRTIQAAVTDTNYYKAYYGLGWGSVNLNGKLYWGHPGRNLCISTDMAYRAADKTGVILLTNGEDDATGFNWCENGDDIVCKLFECADTMNIGNATEINCAMITKPCVHNSSYWLENFESIALNAVPMKIGITILKSSADVFSLLNKEDQSSVLTAIVKELITTRLNIAQGSEFAPLVETIDMADDLISSNALFEKRKIVFDAATELKIKTVTQKLHQYNAGELIKESCSGSSLSHQNQATINGETK